MDLDLLRHIISDINHWPTVESVWLAGFGEPLLHPEYQRCLDLLSESPIVRNARIVLRASLSLLDSEHISLLAAPVLKRLVLSFDGLGGDGSGEVGNSGYERASLDFRDFAAAVRDRRPDLRLTAEPVFPTPDEARGTGPPSLRAAQAALEEALSPIGIEVKSRTPHDCPSSNEMGALRGGCPYVEDDSVYITFDGRVQPCSAVRDPEFNLGNILESDLASLLNRGAMCELRRRLRLDQRAGLPYCESCRISLGGELDDDRLQEYWIARDEMGMIDGLDVRRYLFGSVVPTDHRGLRLDIGGAGSAQPGFICLDRFALPGVNVVTDFDGGLPFADSTFDLVFASHSLEHAADLPGLMREIFRVARDRAQVAILAPYFLTTNNLSNPYHRAVFTEDTPRFWTSCPTSPAGMDQMTARHWLGSWGLAESDRSRPDIDFRCMRMHFFYFPEYRSLPEDEQKRLRQTQLNVCDQIMYHLLVVKRPLHQGEEDEFMKTMQFYEPPYVIVRKQNETIDAQNERIETLLAMVKTKEQELAAAEEKRQTERAHLTAALEAERTAREDAMAALRAQLDAAVRATEMAGSRLLQVESTAARLADELDERSASRFLRWLQRIRPGVDWRGRLGPGFQQFLDDAVIFGTKPRDLVLRPSLSLSHVSFLPYDIVLDRPAWCGVALAPLLDAVRSAGEIVCEIVGPQGQILRHVRLPLDEVRDLQPLRFSFDPIADSDRGTFEMRIAVSGPQIKARVLEWRRPSFAGFRPAGRWPFCAFHFQ